MIVVVGLGNPGKNYEKTIHNMGYMAIDFFAEQHGLKFGKTKHFGKVAEGMIAGEKVLLLKPETYMNLSGKSVEDVMRMHKLNPSEIIVISDDIDLPFGDVRVRAKGSAGTHNGLRDIVSKIGSEFPRVRMGVGRPEHGDLASFVLSKIPEDKLKSLEDKFSIVCRVLDYFVERKTIEGIDVTRI